MMSLTIISREVGLRRLRWISDISTFKPDVGSISMRRPLLFSIVLSTQCLVAVRLVQWRNILPWALGLPEFYWNSLMSFFGFNAKQSCFSIRTASSSTLGVSSDEISMKGGSTIHIHHPELPNNPHSTFPSHIDSYIQDSRTYWCWEGPTVLSINQPWNYHKMKQWVRKHRGAAARLNASTTRACHHTFRNAWDRASLHYPLHPSPSQYTHQKELV